MFKVNRTILAAAVSVVTLASPLCAQSTPNRDAAVEYRKQFMNDLDTLHSKFMQVANAVPAEKYSWRPGTGVRSFGEVLMHVASEYFVYTPLAFGGARSPLIPRGQDSFTKFEANSSKDSVLKHLRDGFAYMKSVVNGMPADSIAGTRKLFGRDLTILETGISMTADLHEHLGQLIAYMRVNGMVPPWSK